MIIIPALDLIDNCAVRLTQGDYKQKTIYSENPVDLAKSFCSLRNIQRLHLVDLSGAKAGSPRHTRLISQIKKETNCIIEAGGGIRSLENADSFFNEGALDDQKDYLMIGTLPVKNPDEFERILNKYTGRILLTLDVWGEELKISGWQEETGIHLYDFMERMISLGVGDYLITQIKRDGMMNGPDFNLYENVLRRFPGIRLTASGGVSSIDDFKQLNEIPGLYGAILGRAFYENKITLDDLRNKKNL